MKQGGYTLLEMIVAIGVFSIVALMAMGATITMLGAYQKTQATQVVVDSLGFSIEAMTRDIRFGTDYRCSDCSGGDDITVDFIEIGETVSEDIKYFLDDSDNRLYREANGETIAVTPSAVRIDTFQVYVSGTGGENAHPRATFFIGGVLEAGSINTDFSLQTTVSQRDSKK